MFTVKQIVIILSITIVTAQSSAMKILGRSIMNTFAKRSITKQHSITKIASTKTTAFQPFQRSLSYFKQTPIKFRFNVNARAKIGVCSVLGIASAYGLHKYNEQLLLLARQYSISVDNLNTNIDMLLAKSITDKTFCIQLIDFAVKNILSIDIEPLKKIAAQYPEAKIKFAQELAKHLPDEIVSTFHEARQLHTLQKPINISEITQRQHMLGAIYCSQPATKAHVELVHAIARKLDLDPTHAIKVYQYTGIRGITSAICTIDTQRDHDCTLSSIADKAKHFIPYIHVLKLEEGFSALTENAQKFIIGHELMHAKLGHTMTRHKDMLESRNREKEADLGSAALGVEFTNGGIDYCSVWRPNYWDKYYLKRYGKRYVTRTEPSDSHPSWDDRIEYLQELIQKKT